MDHSTDEHFDYGVWLERKMDILFRLRNKRAANASSRLEVLTVIENAKAGAKSDKIHIMVGSGCNGKTTFAEEQRSDHCDHIHAEQLPEINEIVQSGKIIIFISSMRPGTLTSRLISKLISMNATFIIITNSLNILEDDGDVERLVIHEFQEKVGNGFFATE